MINGIDIELDLENEYDVCGQKIHMANKLPLRAINTMAKVVADIVLIEDRQSGTVTEDVLMVEPWIARVFTDIATDFDSDKFEGNNYDLYDALFNHERYCCLRWAIFETYAGLKRERIRVYEKAHSLENTIRNIVVSLDGDDATRDIGMIRKMFTEIIEKAKEDAKEEIKAESGNRVVPVDMSIFKEKKKQVRR